MVHRLQVGKTRRPDFQTIGFITAVGNQEYAKLTLRVFHRGIHLTSRQAIAFGKQLEVMDQAFHIRFHFLAPRRHHLVIVAQYRPRIVTQPLDALPDDPVGLAEFLDAHQVAVITIAVGTDRDIEIHIGIYLVGLLLAQIPGHA